MNIRLRTVVETPAYLAAAERLLSDAERNEIVDMVATNSERGISIGGGIRKMRVARRGRGRRSGARVLFLFSGEDIPVFLLAVFAKNEKTDLSPKERAALIATAKEIVDDYRRQT